MSSFFSFSCFTIYASHLPKVESHDESEDIFDFTERSDDKDKWPPPTDPNYHCDDRRAPIASRHFSGRRRAGGARRAKA